MGRESRPPAVFAVLELAEGSLTKLLHSAQLTEQLKPFPPRGVVPTTATLLGIYDMRIGAMLQVETRSSIQGELYARTVWSVLIAGEGNFKSERAPSLLRTKPPKDAAPDFTSTWATRPDQALLYRLTGDLNPIHARPERRRRPGRAPILHGLCTYGFAARAALAVRSVAVTRVAFVRSRRVHQAGGSGPDAHGVRLRAGPVRGRADGAGG